MSRVTVATFDSKCAACGDWIREGDEIVLTPDEEWVHLECEDG